MRRVYTTYVFESPAFERRLGEILATTPTDLIHVDSLDLARYLPACRGVPVVCSHPDVESVLLRRRADVERRPWRRAYIRYQARLRENTERYWTERVALNVAVSNNDRAALACIAPDSRCTVVPNGVDTEEFRPGNVRGSGVAFVGGLHWFPNLDALEFYCRDILPHVRAAHGHVATRWIGSSSTADSQYYRDRFGVELTGYVDDVRPFMHDAACHIVPLRVGGGTRMKILNSWAMGKPVVTTSVGCEGLRAVDGDNALIRDEPEEFAKAIATVLGDRELGRRLGDRGRATVERFYSWDVIGTDLIEAYLEAARVGSTKSASALTSIGAGYGT